LASYGDIGFIHDDNPIKSLDAVHNGKNLVLNMVGWLGAQITLSTILLKLVVNLSNGYQIGNV
jgi:hypothetical protein